MKRKLLALTLSIIAMSLSGCNYFNQIINDFINPSDYDQTDEYIPTEQGVNKIKASYTYSDYTDNSAYDISASPLKGESHLLVIPIWFTDSDTYIKGTGKDKVRNDIQLAYFGTSEETGWESVSSYYKKDSFNNITISGKVSEWYECGKASTDYYSENNSSTKTTTLVNNAVKWYFTNHDDSKTNYDADKNGIIDGVMLIYGAPDYYAMSESSADNMWAYCYWLQSGQKPNTSSPITNVFFWASYDFMYSSGTITKSLVGSQYGSGDQSNCKIDAHTYIHEMGHVFGLEDYYDYNGKVSLAAGFSMQDHNVGAHDPFSRFALGWVNPFVPTETKKFTVGAIENTGECVLLPYEGYTGSPFDEYILLELFTPSNLNELDCKYSYAGTQTGPKNTGVRIWHVDARLASYVSSTNYNITNNPKDGKIVLATSNTLYASDGENNARCSKLTGNYNYNTLHLIKNDKNAKYSDNSFLSNSMLFKTGDTFSLSEFKTQFTNGTQLNSKKTFPWTVKFDEVGSASMTITVTKN